MPPDPSGTLYSTASGWGIRWPEKGRRRRQAGFATKRDAKRWFAEHVAPRLRSGAPSPELTFDAFCALFIERHGATVSPRSNATLVERLAPAREHFGSWKLRELERAADDVAAWRASLSPTSRYRLLGALRQTLGAAQRWGYIASNPAVLAGRNPQPRLEELRPFAREEVDKLAAELGPHDAALVVFAAESGLRTSEWVALERRDLDRAGRACIVQRRYADGVLTGFPKTARSRRRVPLSARALAALDSLPARLDSQLLFPTTSGKHIGLDTWRSRIWAPALDAAGIAQRGPYHLRHTFATEALASGVSIFELARLKGTSVAMIDRTYGHMARDSEASILARLDARARATDNASRA
jgi:integrase